MRRKIYGTVSIFKEHKESMVGAAKINIEDEEDVPQEASLIFL